MSRRLSEIAADVRADWKKINPYAEPYLKAMEEMAGGIDTQYYQDSGLSIVLYFLANASGWRGEKAREIKTELKDMSDRYLEAIR